MADTHGKSIRTNVGLAGQDKIHIDLRAYAVPEQRFLNGKDGEDKTVYVVVFDGSINDVPVLHGRVNEDFATQAEAEDVADKVLDQIMGDAQNDTDTIMALIATYEAKRGKHVH
jgi:hypothetical protein